MPYIWFAWSSLGVRFEFASELPKKLIFWISFSRHYLAKKLSGTSSNNILMPILVKISPIGPGKWFLENPNFWTKRTRRELEANSKRILIFLTEANSKRTRSEPDVRHLKLNIIDLLFSKKNCRSNFWKFWKKTSKF